MRRNRAITRLAVHIASISPPGSTAVAFGRACPGRHFALSIPNEATPNFVTRRGDVQSADYPLIEWRSSIKALAMASPGLRSPRAVT